MERALTSEPTSTRLLVSSSPDPKAAQRYLEDFQELHPDSFDRLGATASGLQYLIAVFPHSRFLSDAILRFPDWIESLVHTTDLYRVLSAEEFKLRLDEAIGQGGD